MKKTPEGSKTKHLKDPKVDDRWFRSQLAAKGLNQRQFGELLKRHPAQVTKILNGQRKLQIEEVYLIAKEFGCSPEEVALHAGIDLPTIQHAALSTKRGETVPVVGWVDEGHIVHRGDNKPLGAARMNQNHPDAEVLRFEAPASKMEGFDGALIYYVQRENSVAEAVGSLCIVDLEDGRSMLASVKKGYTSRGAYNLFDLAGRQLAQDVILKKALPVVTIAFGW